jgi:hypothetical protein
MSEVRVYTFTCSMLYMSEVLQSAPSSCPWCIVLSVALWPRWVSLERDAQECSACQQHWTQPTSSRMVENISRCWNPARHRQELPGGQTQHQIHCM